MVRIPIQYKTKDFQNNTYKKCSPLVLYLQMSYFEFNFDQEFTFGLPYLIPFPV